MEHAPFGEPLETVKLPHCEITLLGTAHVSKASATTVKNLIESGDYDSVAVELCENRYNSIVDPDALGRMDIFAAFRARKIPMITANLALGAFQQRIADQIGIEPGADMRNAIFSAQEKSLPIILVDRDIGTTLKRIYRSIPWYQRFKLFGALFQSVISSQKITEDDIEKLKQGDMLESSFTEFAQTDLQLYKPLINERDQFMAAKILEETKKHNYKKTLVVIGAGHMKGIAEYLKSLAKPEETVKELNEIPSPARWPKFLPWILVAVVITGFIIGFSKDTQHGWALVQAWVLLNGGLCAFGALLAGAHPVTIIASFFVAPLTSLNPMIPAGLVTGPLEAYLRHPHVRDFSHLRHDASTLKGWWHNRITRIFLVFMLCNLGSGIGGWIWISTYLIAGKAAG
jgi:pheromone shutdown-related protein TraB